MLSSPHLQLQLDLGIYLFNNKDIVCRANKGMSHRKRPLCTVRM